MISPRGWLNILRLGLLISSVGWGISFYFTFVSWESAVNQLTAMGAERIEYQPLLDYWLRMASAAFGCVGIGSAIACAWPRKFAGFIWFLGPFHLLVGFTLIVAAVWNQLTPSLHPTFIPDITFCFIAGVLILLPMLCGAVENSGKDE